MGNRGFTLIELLIVIVIIALLAGAMAPLFRTTKIGANLAQMNMAINRLEKEFYICKAEHGWDVGEFLAALDAVRMNELNSDIFTYILGTDPTTTPKGFFIRVKVNNTGEQLCERRFYSDKNIWQLGDHPWAKYLNSPWSE